MYSNTVNRRHLYSSVAPLIYHCFDIHINFLNNQSCFTFDSLHPWFWAIAYFISLPWFSMTPLLFIHSFIRVLIQFIQSLVNSFNCADLCECVGAVARGKAVWKPCRRSRTDIGACLCARVCAAQAAVTSGMTWDSADTCASSPRSDAPPLNVAAS